MITNQFSISVPATTANIGSGFDTSGVALELFNHFHFDFSKNTGLEFINVDERYCNEKNLVYKTFCTVLEQYDIIIPDNFCLSVETNIPIARGLGSSSTCIIAGIYAANIYGELALPLQSLLKLAVQFEGHPDNVVPAILGGMVNSIYEHDQVFYHKIIPNNSLIFYALIDDTEVTTEAARKVMPETLSYDAAIYNISRSSLLLHAFEIGDVNLLPIVTQDAIHQKYREQLIKSFLTYKSDLLREQFISYWISGSGSTILALSIEENKKATDTYLDKLSKKINTLTCLNLPVNTSGVIIKK